MINIKFIPIKRGKNNILNKAKVKIRINFNLALIYIICAFTDLSRHKSCENFTGFCSHEYIIQRLYMFMYLCSRIHILTYRLCFWSHSFKSLNITYSHCSYHKIPKLISFSLSYFQISHRNITVLFHHWDMFNSNN